MRKPELINTNGITIVSPGPEYESIKENVLPYFDDVVEAAEIIDPPLMIIDLANTSFFDSRFLGLLIQLSNQLSRKLGGRLAVCHLSECCQEVISATRLDRLFGVFESRTEAVNALESENLSTFCESRK